MEKNRLIASNPTFIAYTNYLNVTDQNSKCLCTANRQKLGFLLPQIPNSEVFLSGKLIFCIIKIFHSWLYLVAIPVPISSPTSPQTFLFSLFTGSEESF